MSTPKLDIFINEVKSFEYEITIYDRHEDDSKYLDSNFEPIPLLRLPKYIKTDYEKFLTKLQDEALTEILLLDNHKIEKVLYRLNKIEEEFNDHWDSFHTIILKALNKTEENFDRDNDYFEIITLLYSKFGILEFNTNAYYSNGFNGTLGRITEELQWDLYDALITKDGLLHQLIHFTKEYLSSIQPASAEPKVLAVEEQKPAPAVFDNSKLNEVINDDCIDTFLKHEKRLKADGFILQNNTWINGRGKNQTKTLKDLANLILLLKDKKYFKIKFDNKRLKDRDYKKFFENRYACNIKDQFSEAIKAESKHLETAKNTFLFI